MGLTLSAYTQTEGRGETDLQLLTREPLTAARMSCPYITAEKGRTEKNPLDSSWHLRLRWPGQSPLYWQLPLQCHGLI